LKVGFGPGSPGHGIPGIYRPFFGTEIPGNRSGNPGIPGNGIEEKNRFKKDIVSYKMFSFHKLHRFNRGLNEKIVINHEWHLS